MIDALYDSQEYIKTVMRIEQCSREDALKLIEEFKRIDAQKGRIINGMDANQRMKVYREKWRAEGKCTVCGKEDQRTKEFGYSTCEQCSRKQSAYFKEWTKRRKKKNATNRQTNQLHEEA